MNRWHAEHFFKRVRQRSGVKSLCGAGQEEAEAQIRIAVLAHVLVAVLKKRIDVGRSLCTILQILSVSAFGKKEAVSATCGARLQKVAPRSPISGYFIRLKLEHHCNVLIESCPQSPTFEFQIRLMRSNP